MQIDSNHSAPAVVSAASDSESVSAPAPDETLLVVDDDPMVRDVEAQNLCLHVSDHRIVIHYQHRLGQREYSRGSQTSRRWQRMTRITLHWIWMPSFQVSPPRIR